MRSYIGQMFPAAYHDAIFIAEHGSWNRSSKSGYRVVVVHAGKDGKVTGPKAFLTGFLDGQKPLGRPADVQPLRDGSLLVSDDDSGVIYRIIPPPLRGDAFLGKGVCVPSPLPTEGGSRVMALELQGFR